MQNQLHARLVTGAGLLLSFATFAASAQAQSGMDLVHPRLSIGYSASFGDQKFEVINTDIGSFGGTASGVIHHLRGEYFFPSQLGFFANASFGSSDDTLEDSGSDDSGVDSTNIYFGVAYRATIDDTFRIPVRFGPYMHEADVDFDSANSAEYSTFGVKLSAEPEYILRQTITDNRMSEITLFADVGLGTGASDVKGGGTDQTGYAFQTSVELGSRYRMSNGLTFGLSLLYSKTNYGATDSFDDSAFFFGIDDDYTAAALTVAWRR